MASNDFFGRKQPYQQGRGGGPPPRGGQPDQSRVQHQQGDWQPQQEESRFKNAIQTRNNSWQERRPICRYYLEGKCHKDPCNFKHEGEPRNKPKFVISRNDFSKKVENEDEDLFERRDPKEISSWNPSNATVVDYGHGTGSSSQNSMSNILEQVRSMP